MVCTDHHYASAVIELDIDMHTLDVHCCDVSAGCVQYSRNVVAHLQYNIPSLWTTAQTVAPSIVKMLRKCFSNYNELQSGHDRVEMEYSTSFSANRPPSSNNALLPPDPDQRAPRDPSRDAPLRWVALAVFLLVTIATVVSLSVLMIVRGS